MTKNQKISVVIAAYNEEPRIAKVIKAVIHHPLIDEVIVVNDGSSDRTSNEVRKFDVTLIENETNIGKTLSIKRGIEASKNELLMFLDADLIGLDHESVDRLVKPVLDGQVDWTLSINSNALGVMRALKLDWVSGQRVVPKRLLADHLIWSRPDIGYSLETLMNKSLLSRHKTFRSIYMSNVVNTDKAEKNGFIKGWVKEFKMIGQISKVMPLHDILGQFIKMAYLNHKYSQK